MMNENKKNIDIVTHSIDIAIDSVGTVLDLLDDCGLDESGQDMVKESMLTCLKELSTSFDVVDLAKDERVKS